MSNTREEKEAVQKMRFLDVFPNKSCCIIMKPNVIGRSYENPVLSRTSSLFMDSLWQKYSRLRCLLRVKGLVIGFYLGWSGHTLLIRKI